MADPGPFREDALLLRGAAGLRLSLLVLRLSEDERELHVATEWSPLSCGLDLPQGVVEEGAGWGLSPRREHEDVLQIPESWSPETRKPTRAWGCGARLWEECVAQAHRGVPGGAGPLETLLGRPLIPDADTVVIARTPDGYLAEVALRYTLTPTTPVVRLPSLLDPVRKRPGVTGLLEEVKESVPRIELPPDTTSVLLELELLLLEGIAARLKKYVAECEVHEQVALNKREHQQRK